MTDHRTRAQEVLGEQIRRFAGGGDAGPALKLRGSTLTAVIRAMYDYGAERERAGLKNAAAVADAETDNIWAHPHLANDRWHAGRAGMARHIAQSIRALASDGGERSDG